jgi:hypothetical protein
MRKTTRSMYGSTQKQSLSAMAALPPHDPLTGRDPPSNRPPAMPPATHGPCCSPALGRDYGWPAALQARPKVTEVDGRCLAFAIRAKDGTEVIGIGTQERVVIDLIKFFERLKSKFG